MNLRKEIRKVVREQKDFNISENIRSIKELVSDIDELYVQQEEYNRDLEDSVKSQFARAINELSLIRDIFARTTLNNIKEAIVLKTDGKGLWSSQKKNVRCVSLKIGYTDCDYAFKRNTEETQCTFGELKVYFDPASWNIDEDGLIYTDKTFEKQLKEALLSKGFSLKALKKLSYSEQGMQGKNYVSLDVGGDFLYEFAQMTKSDIHDLVGKEIKL